MANIASAKQPQPPLADGAAVKAAAADDKLKSKNAKRRAKKKDQRDTVSRGYYPRRQRCTVTDMSAIMPFL